jgi:hypothetical protein
MCHGPKTFNFLIKKIKLNIQANFNFLKTAFKLKYFNLFICIALQIKVHSCFGIKTLRIREVSFFVQTWPIIFFKSFP